MAKRNPMSDYITTPTAVEWKGCFDADAGAETELMPQTLGLIPGSANSWGTQHSALGEDRVQETGRFTGT